MPQEIKKFRFWVQLEILLILCITIANFLFLLTRSVKRNEFELEFQTYEDRMDQGNELYKKVAREQKDYLQASVLILGFFSTFTAPFIISILL